MSPTVVPSRFLITVASLSFALASITHAQRAPQASTTATQSAQALNPPYLAGFPAVDRVKREIQGSNAVDTLARQVAVLNYLPRIIIRMQMVPGRPYNSPTPDEQRISYEYTLAAYELSQSYTKTASPADAKSFEQMTGRYEMNPTLSDQMYGLLSPATLAEFGKIDRAASARAQARIDQQRREAEQQRSPVAASAAGTGATLPNDPGRVAMRRCLELGGGDFECIGKGIATETGYTELSALLAPDVPRGLRMGGTYRTDAGITIAFDNAKATLSACGKLENEIRDYSITRRGDRLEVGIQTQPRPLVIVLGPDGRFTGPAAFDITGKVITGYKKYWVEERRVSDNSIVIGSGHEVSEPIYEPKTERCAFTSLRASAPVRAQGNVIGMVAGLLGGQADPASQRSGTEEAPAGPRMNGKYAGGGLQLEFHPTAVVIDCGEAHVLKPYTVQNLADRLVVTVRNGTPPLSLTLRSDGALLGSGSTEVTGRVVSGANDNGATFSPRTSRCTVGSLTLR